MCYEDVQKIYEYASKKYPKPEPSLISREFELQCYRIQTYEAVIKLCMDYSRKDPKDVLEEYAMYLESCVSYFSKNFKRSEDYIVKLEVVTDLLTILK